MKRSVLLEMRNTAKRELLAYRRNQELIAAHTLRGEERKQARLWASAIAGAQALLATEMPEKERVMARLFGLNAPFPRYQPVQARIIRLCEEFHISEPTLYKWREDIILLVLGAAIEAGAIRPFQLDKP